MFLEKLGNKGTISSPTEGIFLSSDPTGELWSINYAIELSQSMQRSGAVIV